MIFAKNIKKKPYIMLLLFAVCFAFGNSNCNDLIEEKYRLHKQKYNYYANKTEISNAIAAFTNFYGINVKISENVNGLISGSFKQVSPVTFFESIIDAYSAICYRSDRMLYIYSLSDIKTQDINIDNNLIPIFISKIAETGMEDPKYPIKEIPNAGMIIVTGPPRYIEMLMAINEGIAREANVYKHKIIHIKHKNVADTRIESGGASKIKMGVASILQNIIKQKTDNNSNITYDITTNSIILYDNERNLREYEEIIKDIDQPSQSIRITVKAIDIVTSLLSSTEANSLASNLKAANKNKDLSQSIVDSILNQVSALSKKEAAKIASDMSIVTSNNTPAILSLSTKSSNQENQNTKKDIFMRNNNTNTSQSIITVTPQVINKGKYIKLQLKIEYSYTSNSIPNNVNISTEIKVKNDKFTLLSSGSNAISEADISGDPVLSKFPILGNMLFKGKGSKGMKALKLFVIYAKIL